MNSSIHRVPKDKDHPFTKIPNAIIDNTELSPEARIILIKMIRNVDGYSYSVDKISKSTGISLAKVKRAIKELIEAGHLRARKERLKGVGSGRGFTATYEIFEEPIAKISSLEGVSI